MASMEKYMAESYGGRIFIELLQNADDANSTKIRLCDYEGHLIFANNGRPFSETDVIAISRSGASSKERGITIGYRGIGFKSTTYLTSDIIIYSDRTYFTFSKAMCSTTLNRDESKIPTVRIPFLLENLETKLDQYVQELVLEGFTTIFIFKNAKLNEFVEEVKEINNGYFLFLRSIESCRIDLKNITTAFTINRNTTNFGSIVSMASNKNDQWLIVEDDQIKLAFKYDAGKVYPCDEDESVFHSYLPTLDSVTYPIKINCDFSTDPSRKHLTIDDATVLALQRSANTLFVLIESVLNGKLNESVYSNLFTILCQRSSFSKANAILNDSLKQNLIASDWLKLNNGQAINPVGYKILPDWLEESEKTFLRTNSKYIQAQSVFLVAYKNILQIDSFLQQYSQNKYSIEDFVEIMKDANLVSNLNHQTHGKIFANILKTGMSDQFISGKEHKFGDILMQTNAGINTVSSISKDKSIILDRSFRDAINQYSSRGEIEWFCKKVSISEDEIVNDFPLKAKIFEGELKKIDIANNKLSVSKWRSAEQQCVEIEKHRGYDSIDVSKQNVGYDVESTTKDGAKRYIEVKSINAKGSPFSMTNNEYTAAHQYGDSYYLCLIVQSDKKLIVLYIRNPLNSLQFEKRIRQWEWYCDNYDGEETSIEY